MRWSVNVVRIYFVCVCVCVSIMATAVSEARKDKKRVLVLGGICH